MTADKTDDEDTVTRQDLDSALRSVVGEAEQKATSSARRLLPVAVGVGVVMLVAAYYLGRRVGTVRSTVVEIRRI